MYCKSEVKTRWRGKEYEEGVAISLLIVGDRLGGFIANNSIPAHVHYLLIHHFEDETL